MIDLDKLKSSQDKFIADLEAKYGKSAVTLQTRLINAINDELLSKLKVIDGNVVNTPENYRLIYEFENVWQKYSDTYFAPAVQGIGADALKVTSFSTPYFKELGVTGSNAAKLFAAASKNIELMMGIERVGNEMKFIPGGYLDRFLQGAEIKDQVMSVLTDGVSVRTGFSELNKTMREVVAGSPDVDGSMQRYFRGYVYDTFSGVQRTYDNYVAEGAGMNSWIYAGTVITSTREFCKLHVGQVFNREDIDKFDADDWAGKIPGVPFTVQMGGYNCRHSMRWIPDELKKEFT